MRYKEAAEIMALTRVLNVCKYLLLKHSIVFTNIDTYLHIFSHPSSSCSETERVWKVEASRNKEENIWYFGEYYIMCL